MNVSQSIESMKVSRVNLAAVQRALGATGKNGSACLERREGVLPRLPAMREFLLNNVEYRHRVAETLLYLDVAERQGDECYF